MTSLSFGVVGAAGVSSSPLTSLSFGAVGAAGVSSSLLTSLSFGAVGAAIEPIAFCQPLISASGSTVKLALLASLYSSSPGTRIFSPTWKASTLSLPNFLIKSLFNSLKLLISSSVASLPNNLLAVLLKVSPFFTYTYVLPSLSYSIT